MLISCLGLAWAGTEVRSGADGWALTAPDGWSASIQDGGGWLITNGSQLVLVTYVHGADLKDLTAQAAQSIQDGGLVLTPVGPPSVRDRTVAVDYSGRTVDGTGVAAHGVAVVGPSGGLVVLGVGATTQLPMATQITEELASTTVWAKPDTKSVGTLTGALCGGKATLRMAFDGKGKVSTASPLTPPDAGGVYTVSGDEVVVRFKDGAERRCQVAERDAAGAVGALSCGGNPWTRAACEAP